ncbi:hypothetical protein AKG07_08795 [Microbacterium sp. CGR1]|uniref:helix-turn-helix transcriptional regulator n=1 Tax=Microbacterium sp. CGR1 TaxID=1696072 RepID=UPI00069F3315|nr:helix-turn-helix transcriptional regulator [Microbacterium sp. CGR1]AKV86382.1 hypothetical protein AKG07_08795 [Microbacterium sp. CGR1]
MTDDEPLAVFDDDMDARFAASVAELRKARGWSQERLAKMLTRRGVRDMTGLVISRIEAGRRKVRLQEAVGLAQVFGVTLLSMTKQDEMLNAIVLLSGQVRDLRALQSDFLDTAERFAANVHESATYVLRVIDDLRASGDLDADAQDLLSRYERGARGALEFGPSEIASKVTWPRTPEGKNGERQAEV